MKRPLEPLNSLNPLKPAGVDSEGSSAVSLACVPGAIPAAERPAHFALLTRLLGEHAREREDLANGYAIRFDAEAFDDIARFVTNERRCCPFMSFTIELSADSGPIWLRLSGPAGTRDFLAAGLQQQG